MSCLALNEINSITIVDQNLISRSELIKKIFQLVIDSHISLLTYSFSNMYSLISEPNHLEQFRLVQDKQCICLLNLLHCFPGYKSNVDYLRQQEQV
jgi:hypothetical protein